MGRRTAVGVLSCALLLAGCAQKHQASQSLPAASSTPEGITTHELPDVGPADFPVPLEARQHTAAGVQAFTRYYVELLDRQMASLDPDPFLNVSRSCRTCDELAQSIQQIKTAGRQFRGGEITVSDMGSAVVKGDEGETSFVLDESPTTVVDPTGAVVEVRSTKPSRYTGGVVLRWNVARSTWLMAQFDADPL